MGGWIQINIAAYMQYYNLDRPHTANNVMSPISYEKPFRKSPEKVVQNYTIRGLEGV